MFSAKISLGMLLVLAAQSLPSAWAVASGTALSGVDTPPPTVDSLGGAATRVCGDGLLGKSESCAACPVDCVAQACTAVAPTHMVRVDFTAPAGRAATAVTVRVGYRGSIVSLPGSGDAASVRDRLKKTPPNSIVQVNDLDYGLRVVLGRSNGLAIGSIFAVDFDGCRGAPVPTAADFACTIEGCGGGSGPIRGCDCSVAVGP